MKPIFKEERDFLERKLNVEIPVNSWRNGSKIYSIVSICQAFPIAALLLFSLTPKV